MKNILLVGAPNSGKSALFNQLTGLSHKVANYPGITVDVGTGALRADSHLTVWDFPGTYSLTALSGAEQVAIDTLRTALKSEEQICGFTRGPIHQTQHQEAQNSYYQNEKKCHLWLPHMFG